MDADEAIGVHPRLQRLDRLVDQPASRADVHPHIVALRLDQVYLPGVEPQHLAEVLDPEFGDSLALALIALIGRAPFADAGEGARQPLGRHPLRSEENQIELQSLTRISKAS